MKDKKMIQVEEQLQKLGIQYEFIALPEDLPIDVASHMQFHRKPVGFAVANIVYRTEKGFIVAQKRADTEIDSEKLKKLIGVTKLSFANKQDLEALGLRAGLVPPIGYDVIFYMDKKVLENKEVYTGSGDALFDLKINPKDLIKVNKATIGDFTMTENNRGKRVYSGIRATGRLHLGNYMGAVKGMLQLQDAYDCVFSVVDLHAITTPYDPSALQSSVRDVVLDYLAAGLDPEKCLLEVQSKVPQHMELAYYLSTIYPVSRLEDLPTYKDKKAQHPKYVNMGLLYYPVLMAADVLLYKGELVPVGIDQEPHLEVMRELARKFNSMFGETFPEPQRFATPGEYVPSLAGAGKMSKSVEGSFITLTDDLETIKKRLAAAPTDSGVLGGSIPKEGGVANLFALMRLFATGDMHHKYVQDYKDKTIRYGEMKKDLAEAIYTELQPIQEKRKEFESNTQLVDSIIEEHAAKCRERAEVTLTEVRQKMGLR